MLTSDYPHWNFYEGIGSNSGLIWLCDNENMYMLTNFTNTLATSEVNSQSKTKVYPNPFTDKIQIENSTEIKELQLFDSSGKLIATQKSQSELNNRLPALKNGIYLLKINFENKNSETIKLIKNK